MEDEPRASLRESYGRKARERDLDAIQPWKSEERLRFLTLLQSEERRTLLELNAGPGKDGKIVSASFDIRSFRRIALGERADGLHFQSLILRKAQRPGYT